MTDASWIGAVLTAQRPRVTAALLRYFRDLDKAEEAFQEACLRALKSWARNGPPRDAAAWLVMVGRNAGVDAIRRSAKEAPLPPEEKISDLSDVETPILERIETADYRDDVLRLMFICCHRDLPATQQIALALRIVSGLPVSRIARAFLVSEAAMEQRITRAKAKVAAARIPFDAPAPGERADRVAAVASMIYLIFNEGYTGETAGNAAVQTFCEEAIRLSRLLLGMYPSEPELLGLTALLLLQHSRAAARYDKDGGPVLLDNQDRALWDGKSIAEALALIDKALRHASPGPYQVQAAIAALHARAKRPEDTDWRQIELLYAALERLQPSPVVTLNRAVAVSKARGAEAALAMVEPLATALERYFYFHGTRGSLLLDLGRDGEAREAFARAIALANTAAEATSIRAMIDTIENRHATRSVPGKCPAP